ncbi:MAG TPA: methyltransferase domain-containing protein [Methylomusa anaerophila]|uniref:Methyltransferase domain protein n=2 Tax=Methylomusa anaerophila TaxID=1930071 RepID=A0A348AKQ6_9FIRM|nr:methyltransferase domain protein [Methylomusa anaerophila]HML88612.1 methyltransferase domain-containing protein [Methylomusa anaerophila]
MKKFLHVGCGPHNPKRTADIFPPAEWEEVRLDIDANVKPDIVGDITDMAAVAAAEYDALFSSHNLEHLYAHQVPLALAEFFRVLKSGGYAIIRVPNIQEVAEEVAKGNLEGLLYTAPAGQIAAIDILYGFRPSVAAGNYFMAHKTAFTPQTLGMKLVSIGFKDVKLRRDSPYGMEAVAYKA